MPHILGLIFFFSHCDLAHMSVSAGNIHSDLIPNMEVYITNQLSQPGDSTNAKFEQTCNPKIKSSQYRSLHYQHGLVQDFVTKVKLNFCQVFKRLFKEFSSLSESYYTKPRQKLCKMFYFDFTLVCKSKCSTTQISWILGSQIVKF